MISYQQWSLEKRFAVFSLLVMFVLGTLLSAISSWYNTRESMRSSSYYIEKWFNAIIKHEFSSKDFNGPISEERFQELSQYISKNVLDQNIKRVKVWDRTGRVVFSDEKNIVGQQFTISDNLKDALDGHVAMDFSNLHEVEQASVQHLAKALLEVYLPFQDDDTGEILGAYEVYVTDQALYDEIIHNRKLILVTVASSFIVLYLILLGIIRQASKTIKDQNGEIKLLSFQLEEKIRWQEHSQAGTIKAFMLALAAKDKYTAGHAMRVEKFALMIGNTLGLSPEELRFLGEACLFHDIGKVGIPEQILNKQGKLTPEDFDIMKTHPVTGADIIASIPNYSEHALIIRHHHERVDGLGYPDGLTREQIPLASRIISVSDTFDALTSDRPYRKALSYQLALNILHEVKGTQLDEAIVEIFSQCIWQANHKTAS